MADVELKATGKVVTGFSYPMVGVYSANGGTVTYSNAMELARGVDVTPDITSSDANNFYANNAVAESAPQKFTKGTLSITVDGLLNKAKKLIYGLPDEGTDGWTHIGDDMDVPYVGYGHVVRFMSGGVESYQAFFYPRVKFNLSGGVNAATQEDEIDWQTTELSATIYRSENANHDWHMYSKDYASEDEALTALKTILGMTADTNSADDTTYGD